ncbi:hypothetical protein DICPUDRAFT_87573 [Dictyostelium purpureum]|uniref:Protein HIRA n=1 Tax=Dictyostelium purpureum TaxID=5786 RepID=F0ZJ00_DICPU|nr:uncharacterized protein DICPUDRAFT_87573 [Dictyostelium purpureum]EGC36084.1 hypothetical protein DICPUDRAFT_87573 [Dictyostelium purpureum]|eukprot:XP_003287402.1 hypothetical protein DICPUDRAFT_87573 [Dictyostelium purpureum]
MKIIKPQWISHSGLSIYSIDVHPDGTRLATGGGDAKIKIWSVAPISLSEVENDENTPKLLCSIENSHFQTVNSVKWSKDGKYLASSSDDKLCMIWGLSKSNYMKSSVENWVCVATLRAHSGDISEVSWSPDNKYLATCSFDKTIIIWETSKFAMVTKLEEHKGFVKGLTWDPLGRYLASQSEDKSLIVWRTSDWVIETVITEPFQHNGNSFFLRPSWTPDGQFIVATHGINNATHTGVLIQRTDWKLGLDLVGHKRAVVVSRCSPIIYKEFKFKDRNFCLILLGGQDSTISLWSSSSPRSLMVAHSLFDQSIQDISWCPDGLSFVVCSTDGTVGYISLSEEEIGGTPITAAEKQTFFRNYYGDSVQLDKDGNLIYGGGNIQSSAANSGSHAVLPENPDQLAMEESIGGSGNNSSNAQNLENNNSDLPTPTTTSNKEIQPTQVALQNQKQTIVNGKRRITPIFIGNSSQNITKPQPLAIPLHLQQQVSKTTSPSPSTTATPTISNDLNGTPFKGGVRDDIVMDVSPIQEKLMQRGRDKRKDDDDNIIDKKPVTTSDRDDHFISDSSSTPHHKKKKSHHHHHHKEKESQQKESQQKEQPENNFHNQIVSTSIPSGFSIALPIISNKISKKIITEPQQPLNQIMNRFSETNTTTNQPSPSPPIVVDVNIVETELHDETVEYFSMIRYLTYDTQLWEVKIPGRVTLVTGNKYWCAVTTQDSILHVFNKNGAVIMSNLVLRNQISFLESNKTTHLLAITCDGFVSVWNILKKKSVLSNRELPFIKNRENLTIKHAFVTEETGKPIVTFSNGDSFVFCKEVSEWVKITDRLGALSEFNSVDTSNTGILSTLQKMGNKLGNSGIGSISSGNNSNNANDNATLSNLLALTNSESQSNQQQLLSTLFLEKQLWLSQVLESPQEYHHWLLIYAKYLTNSGSILKLQDLCTDLLGPSSTLNILDDIDSNTSFNTSQFNSSSLFNNPLSSIIPSWEATILGHQKRNLLKEILPIMASNRNLQRLVGQFRESLNNFSKNIILSDPFENLK